jgi:hypothetical protein
MLYKQVSELQAMQGAQAFLDDNAAVLGKVNKSRVRLALDEVVTGLNRNHDKQHAERDTAVSQTEDRGTLQDTLRVVHMKPIAEIARSKLVAAPKISEMRLPRQNISAPRLASKARAMADRAEQYKQVFLDEQLPEDFLEQLRAAADAVDTATLERNNSRANLVEATEGVDALIARGRSVMRVLDAMVAGQLLQRPELLRKWRFVKHVARKPGVPRGTTVATTATAATVAPPAPTPTPAPGTALALVVSPPTPAEHAQPDGGELAAAA